MMKTISKITAKKAVITAVLAYLSLILSQVVAVLIGQAIGKLGISDIGISAISGILYIIFIYLCLRVLSEKVLGIEIEFCRITNVSIKPIWFIVALILPITVSGVYLLMSGSTVDMPMNSSEIWYTIVDAVVFYGLAAGIAEELVFRGIIMTALERRWNKYIAIIIPSVVFALSHIIGAELDFMSIVQLLIAGTLVGCMFCLITYESGTVWNSVIIHVLWNIIIIGGIMHIGVKPNEYFLFNYVLDNKSFMITGGDFGIEASIVSIIGYSIVSVLAIFLMRKRKLNIEWCNKPKI